MNTPNLFSIAFYDSATTATSSVASIANLTSVAYMNNYVTQFTGYYVPSKTGYFWFQASYSDDWALMWLDAGQYCGALSCPPEPQNSLSICNWGGSFQPANFTSCVSSDSVFLEAGTPYAIRLIYGQGVSYNGYGAYSVVYGSNSTHCLTTTGGLAPVSQALQQVRICFI